MATQRSSSNLVWLDLEMTGLDPERHTIVEIGSLVTDAELNVLAEGPCLPVRLSQAEWDAIDAWSAEHHEKSGLLADARAKGVSLEEAERQTLEFVKQYVEEKKSPLCGNSIWHDRRFLIKYMPALNDFFHHRIVDVSSVKELVDRWYPGFQHPEKHKAHRVMDDVRESLEELRMYRERVFVPTLVQREE